MLKTVSSVANALGALNYKGTWNASTNTPTLASGVGTQGDYYVVSVDGATNLDGITNWGVGDWAAFNGSVWQRVEGGADGNFVNLDVTGNLTLPDNSKAIFGTGSGDLEIYHDSGNSYIKDVGTNDLRIWADNPNISSLSGNKYFYGNSGVAELFYNGSKRFYTTSGGSTIVGNLAFASGDGIDFSATAGTGTSELFDDYEEGTWTPTIIGTTGSAPIATLVAATYTKVGDMVTVFGYWTTNFSSHTITGDVQIGGLPFAATTNNNQLASITYSNWATFDQADISLSARISSSTARLLRGSSTTAVVTGDLTTAVDATIMFGGTYKA